MIELINKSGYTYEQLTSIKKDRDLSTVRWILYEHLRKKRFSLEQIGMIFNRSHCSVLHGLNQLEEMPNEPTIRRWREGLFN